MSARRPITLGIAFAVCVMTPAAVTRSQDDPPPERPRCIDLRRIDRTETVGDRDILFLMKNRVTYRNHLPHACAGLTRQDPFMYRVVLGQLCDTDVITMLERWTFGFTPTESCLLGTFERIDNDAAEALRAAAKATTTRGRN